MQRSRRWFNLGESLCLGMECGMWPTVLDLLERKVPRLPLSAAIESKAFLGNLPGRTNVPSGTGTIQAKMTSRFWRLWRPHPPCLRYLSLHSCPCLPFSFAATTHVWETPSVQFSGLICAVCVPPEVSAFGSRSRGTRSAMTMKESLAHDFRRVSPLLSRPEG